MSRDNLIVPNMDDGGEPTPAPAVAADPKPSQNATGAGAADVLNTTIVASAIPTESEA